MSKRTLLLLIALACAGCGDSETTTPTPAENAALDAVPPAPRADGTIVENGVVPDNMTTAAAATTLAAYAGKYPFEKLDGVAFMAHPLVIAGVEKAVGDAEVKRWVLKDDAGPSTPIVLKDGRLLSWRCQQHNCGDHNWTILIDPASAATEVCYHNAELTGEGARWYRPGAEPEKRDAGCQSE